ncbi:MAG: DNA translocase FtsK [Candidatus Omnitrophica bacterium]|nr:DNA translocase FtsK [Candidatus Omnitrophota bacterium]
MKQEHISEIKAISILVIGIILLASLMSFVPEDLAWFTSHPNIHAKNLIGTTGAYIGGVLFFIFGYSAYTLVLLVLFWSWNKFSSRELEFSFAKFIGLLVLIGVVSSLLSMIGGQEDIFKFQRGGILGSFISDFLVQRLARLGAYILLFAFGTLALIITGEFLVTPIILNGLEKGRNFLNAFKERLQKKKLAAELAKPKIGAPVFPKNKPADTKKIVSEKAAGESLEAEEEIEEDEDAELTPKKKVEKPKIRIAPSETKKDKVSDEEPKIVGVYHLPSLDLLEDAPQVPANKIQDGLMNGAKLLEETLSNFGVLAKVVDIERGPAITRYELEPAPGVKVQKFTTLQDDIALAMKAPTVRIVAPIPGKNRIGIEVPNADSSFVFLKDVLSSNEFRAAGSKLMLALGKDIAGQPMVADLAEMPHLLIAGTTGSGKSVCINGIIMSILFNASPDEVKLIMVDPKMVELAQYNGIPHLLCPTVTDPKKASAVLNWVVGEMESRYKKLSQDGSRNIKMYNEKGNKMPYMVIILDELADLMQVSAKSVESAVTRIAQLSRAVGIHLIIATQRPSVDVLTGVIKANFPARISFKVAQKNDSRVVLDMNGAETLLGRGDMLFIKPGDAKPTRGQGNFVKDKEISEVVQFIRDQQEPLYDESIIQQQKSGGLEGSDEKDEYYDEAVQLVIETGQASVSILQRRMRLGYTRAARLIDMMEQRGIVGPYCGSKPRDILVDREQWLLENMNNQDKGEGPQDDQQSSE